MKRAIKTCCQFCIGGIGYYIIEIIWKMVIHNGSWPHLSMIVLGGLSLILICEIDDRLKCFIVLKALLSGAGITLMEFCLGCFYKFVLHNPLWTYAVADFMGIISFTWSMLWCGLSLIVLIAKKILNTIQND